MKVLIVSAEVWQDGTNGGNVLSNIFADTGFEFAQIYCNPGSPQNSLCTRYYQMTDRMAIRSFFSRKPVGRSFDYDASAVRETEEAPEQPDKRFYSFFKRHRLGIFYTAKDILWNCSCWKNEGLDSFVRDFAPDVVFAPCYGDIFMQRLTRYIAALTGKKIISYISDDSYTLHHFSLSPHFWISRFLVRHQLRKTFPLYSLVYTMTETQKAQCERDFGANMKILLKSASFGAVEEKTAWNTPLRIVYAGGIYLNRWKTLAALAKEIRAINQNGIRVVLDIYTTNECSRKTVAALNDGISSTLHPAVSQSELAEIYHRSDIALHAEPFDLKNRLVFRMSFSTKIVDCLSSGCAVMAICDAKQGGYCYLKENDAAICIDDPKSIAPVLRQLVSEPQLVLDYQKKALRLCRDQHDRTKISWEIISDFQAITQL